VLVAVSPLAAGEAGFSVKEKDETSPSNRFRRDTLMAFIHRFAGV